MTAEQYAYWLNGFVELTEWKQPTPEQWKSICEHLGTVFNKVTPSVQFRVDGIRSAELRLSDALRNNQPGMPTITC
jgi:hypothetical protein